MKTTCKVKQLFSSKINIYQGMEEVVDWGHQVTQFEFYIENNFLKKYYFSWFIYSIFVFIITTNTRHI